MNILATELNRKLSQAFYNRVASDSLCLSAVAVFWRSIGLGLIMLGLGVAVGIGFYGYSYITRRSNTQDVLTAALMKALAEVKLQADAEGMVQLQPNEVTLSKGQTISIDSGSRLLLDPTAKVNADGDIRVQVPTVSVPENVASKTSAARPVLTKFTVFKSVAFERGSVVTGWNFLTSAQKSPTDQYCYYIENLETEGLGVHLDIAVDERFDPPKTLPKGFDAQSAFSRCVWFKAG